MQGVINIDSRYTHMGSRMRPGRQVIQWPYCTNTPNFTAIITTLSHELQVLELDFKFVLFFKV